MFIYCLDEKLKQELELKGYKLMKETNMNGQPCWIFANKGGKFDFTTVESKKYLFSNKLNF